MTFVRFDENDTKLNLEKLNIEFDESNADNLIYILKEKQHSYENESEPKNFHNI
jgi:hypothetical protein